MTVGERHPGTVAVQQLRPGDHAFVCHDGDLEGWDVLSAFVWSGLAHGEKVLVLVPPGLTERAVWGRLQEAPGLLLAAGYTSGQLILRSMRQLLGPHDRFSADRQWQRIREETERAGQEGYTGLRAYVDMGWVLDLGADVEEMMDRERRSGHLFATGTYSEVCAYDRRQFPDHVLEAMSRAHPRNLLPRLGDLRALHGAGWLRLVGEADLATREQFLKALARAVAGSSARSPVTIDLTGLTFLGAECAATLADALGGPHGPATVRVRCRSRDAALLRRLGAAPASLEVRATERAARG